MNDTLLFYVSIFVFSMMGIGLLLTMQEFRSLNKHGTRARRRRSIWLSRDSIDNYTKFGDNTEVLQPVRIPSDQRWWST